MPNTNTKPAIEKMKARFEGKCDQCQRDIKKDWDIVYDRVNKKVYCIVCGTPKLNGQQVNASSGGQIDTSAEMEMLKSMLTPEQLAEYEKEAEKIKNPVDPTVEFQAELISEIRLLNASFTLILESYNDKMADLISAINGLHTAVGIIGKYIEPASEKVKKETK